jgi:hypothetical protein
MPQPHVGRSAKSRQRRRGRGELPDAVEGQITEMCRDLVVQVKQVRRLQEQAEELRVVIREWASQPESNSDLGPT